MTLPYLTPILGPDLAALGIPAPWGFGIADRVRFGELDALGHVNNTAYLRWFESFRLPYLSHCKVTQYRPEDPRLVLAEIGCRFRAEMLNGEDYIVTGRTRSFRTSSFVMDYAVWRLPDPLLCAEAHAVIVLRSPDGSGKFPIPGAARQAFEAGGAVSET